MTRRVVVTGMSGVTAFGNDCAHRAKTKSLWKMPLNICQVLSSMMVSTQSFVAPIDDLITTNIKVRWASTWHGTCISLGSHCGDRKCIRASRADWPRIFLTNGETVLLTVLPLAVLMPLARSVWCWTRSRHEQSQQPLTFKSMPHTAAGKRRAVLLVYVAVWFPPAVRICGFLRRLVTLLWRIKHGYQTVMVAGGGEELCPTSSLPFSIPFGYQFKTTHPRNPQPIRQRAWWLGYRWRCRYACSWRVWACGCSRCQDSRWNHRLCQ